MTRLEALRKRIAPLLKSIKISLSPNRSSRGGAKPRMSVIHTTESGPGSLWGVVNYFHNAGIDVSSTYVVGDVEKPNGLVDVVMCVPENEKPWTQKSANPMMRIPMRFSKPARKGAAIAKRRSLPATATLETAMPSPRMNGM